MDYIAFATAAPVAMTKKKSLMWAIKSLLSQLATTFKAMCYHHDQFDDQCVLFRRRRLYRCYNPHKPTKHNFRFGKSFNSGESVENHVTGDIWGGPPEAVDPSIPI